MIRGLMIRLTSLFFLTFIAATAFAQPAPTKGDRTDGATQAAATAQTVTLERNTATVILEPYAPNIVRVTISTIAKEAQAGPGYGFTAAADNTGWKHDTGSDGGDTYTSGRMIVAV